MQNGEERKAAGAELAERVLRLGRNGLSRAEIATELGVGLAELARMERRSERLATALGRAADAERAWWEAQPREALAAGARFNMSAWRAAMGWRFGAAGAAASGAGAARDAAAAARGAPERPRTIYLIPTNGRERGPDGKPLSADQRRALEAKPVLAEIARLEARLAEWREMLSEIEAKEFDEPDDDEEDDWDEDDEGGDDEDCDAEDGRDDEDGESDGRDERDGDEHGRDERGGAGDPLPLAPGGESPPPGGGGEGAGGGGGGGADDGWLSTDPARCLWPVPARGAGASAWIAQPDLGAGGADAAAGLRDRQR